MVYAAYNYTITDETGDLVTGASVEVRRESDNVLATLYSDRAGASALANPFTDSTGTGRFHVTGGAYKVTATKGAFTRSFRFVAIGLAAEQDFVFESITAATANEGISVDNTDPANPTISGVEFTGDSGSGGTIGMVPAPAAGDAAAGKFLSADGLWQAITAAGGDGARIKAFTAGGIYTPASDVRGAVFFVTGGGGGGCGHYGTGTAGASTATGASGGGGGGGGGTVIFGLSRSQMFTGSTANTFQLIVGSGAAATPNSASSPGIPTSGASSVTVGSTLIATANGGAGGARGVIQTTAAVTHGAGGAGGSGSVNTGYLSAGTYSIIPGQNGETDGSVSGGVSVNLGIAKTAGGGGTFWGPGPAGGQGGSGTQPATATNIIYNGPAGTLPGTGGGGGAMIIKNTTSIAAASQPVGGAGANGIILIMEIL